MLWKLPGLPFSVEGVTLLPSAVYTRAGSFPLPADSDSYYLRSNSSQLLYFVNFVITQWVFSYFPLLGIISF